MKYKLILTTALLFLFFSCGYKSPTEDIVLNNGEKWQVIESMIVYIRAMETDIASFANTEQKDYVDLSTKLDDNIKLLTANCTMKGQAHDELHNWLLRHMGLVKDLSRAKGDKEAEATFNKLEVSFETFNQYFR